MPTVAELSVKIDAEDDATATILALDALIKGLTKGPAKIKVKADTGDAKGDIAHLIADINAIGDKVLKVNVESDATAEIAKLRAQLAAIPDEKVSLETDIDSAALRRTTMSMGRLTNAALNASRQVSLMAAAVLGLGAALAPLGAVAIGGVVALASAFTIAGIGAGLFGAVAVSAFSEVKDALKKTTTLQETYNHAVTDKQREAALEKMQAIFQSLDKDQQRAFLSVRQFQFAWQDLVNKFRPQVFRIASEGMQGLAGLLPSLEPIIRGAGDAFLHLQRWAFEALAGPFWQSFISDIGANTGDVMKDLGRSIGNLITGFAAIIQAFLPTTRDFSGGLLEMTQRFKEWAQGLKDSEGFKNFISYMRANVPVVLGFIGSLVTGFISLMKAAAPLGGQLLALATGMFEAFSAFQAAHPAIAAAAVAALAFGAVAINLIGPIIAIGRFVVILVRGFGLLFTMIRFVAVALGLGSIAFFAIVAAIALVAAGIWYAYTHFEQFRNIVNQVASAVMTGLTAAWNWLQSTFGPAVAAVMDFVVQQFNKVRDWITQNQETFRAAWETIKVIISGVWAGIVSTITMALGIIMAIWSATWPIILAVVQGVWTAIKGVISGVLDIIMGIILVFAGILAGNWTAIWNGIVQILRGVWSIIVGIVKGGFHILETITWTVLGAIGAFFKAGWNLMVAGLRAAWETIKSIVRAGWTAVSAAFSSFQRGVQAGVDAFWRGLIAAARGALNLFVDGIRAAFNTAKSIVQGVASAMVSIVTGLAGRFFAAGQDIMSQLAAGIGRGIEAAKDAVRGAVSELTSLLPGSPAKEGPLSGQGYALIRGQHLTQDLAAGIASRASLVAAATQKVADTMALAAQPGGLALGIPRATGLGYGGGGDTISIAPGAVVVQVGSGVSVAEAQEAFGDAGDDLADKLLDALRRR